MEIVLQNIKFDTFIIDFCAILDNCRKLEGYLDPKENIYAG